MPKHPASAAGRVQQPAEHLQRRRLAGAVGPEEADHLAGVDRERDRIDRGDLSRLAVDQAADRGAQALLAHGNLEGLGQIVHLDDGHGIILPHRLRCAAEELRRGHVAARPLASAACPRLYSTTRSTSRSSAARASFVGSAASSWRSAAEPTARSSRPSPSRFWGDGAHAVTAVSPSLAGDEEADCRALADGMGPALDAGRHARDGARRVPASTTAIAATTARPS